MKKRWRRRMPCQRFCFAEDALLCGKMLQIDNNAKKTERQGYEKENTAVDPGGDRSGNFCRMLALHIH